MKFIGARLSRAEWVPGDGVKGGRALHRSRESPNLSDPLETEAGDQRLCWRWAWQGEAVVLGMCLGCATCTHRIPSEGSAADSPRQRHFGMQPSNIGALLGEREVVRRAARTHSQNPSEQELQALGASLAGVHYPAISPGLCIRVRAQFSNCR